ncbi:MAG TPA: arginase family protein [Candidatus Saccharimonadales bacterium]|nr:arginase family protein [Candidatus Saccharimonadales bacterium]
MGDRLDLPFTGLVSFLRAPTCTNLAELDADVAVLGFPSDEGTGWLPGARLGPRRLRELSMRFAGGTPQSRGGFWDIDEGLRFLDYELENRRIVDCGDVDVIYTRPDQSWDNATGMVRTILDRGAMPVVLGGDHGISYSIVRAFSERLTVVHFDAHVDYQPFVHGVIHSHGNPMRMIATLDHVERIIQVGIRSFRTHEEDASDSIRDGNAIVTARDLRRRGPEGLAALLPKDGAVYVSIDVDVLDPSIVPGTSAPEPSGLSYDELRDALIAIARRAHVIGLDLVEVNPMIDNAAQLTSFIGVQLIVEFLARIVEHPVYRQSHPLRPASGS